ncbi:MAG: outer membrane protein assembly factor BamB family protein [Planctomycetota bacterium]|jgi:outer membrane protein assembly factor BamB
MKKSAIAKTIPFGLATAAVVLLYVWLSADAGVDFTQRLPGRDGRPIESVDANEPIKITGVLAAFDGVPADLPGAWPRFRGANFDAISTEDVPLAKTWPAEGPKVLWSIEVGEGFAGAAIFAGRVYVMDYDREGQADVVRCLSLEDGRDIWRYSYPVKIKRNHGMSRTVPTVTEKYVVTMGPKCHVTCLDSTTGNFRWMFNLVREFGTKIPMWYTAQCPVIEDDKTIIAPAGNINVADSNQITALEGGVLMMAVDCESGQIVWQTPNPDGWIMTHSSIVPMEFGGKRFYIYSGGNNKKGGVVGVSAEDGSVLWKTEEWKVGYSVPIPVVVGQDRIFLTAGYNQYEHGCMMLRLVEVDGQITAEPQFLHPTDVFGSIQQTPILYEGYIYGVSPVARDEQLICLDLEGNVVWTSTSAHTFGKGPFTIAGGLIYIMNDSGELSLVKPGGSGYVELAKAKVMDGNESWGPMAIASGRLIARDMNQMVCLDISGQ